MGGGKTSLSKALRGCAVVFYMIAAIIMFLSHQKIDNYFYNFYDLIVKFNQWDSLQYFAAINVVGCVYNCLIFLLPSGSPLWKTVVVLDVVVNLVVGISIGVGWQTYSLMMNGNAHVGWLPICGVVSAFCKDVVISLSFCSAGFLASFVLLMYTLIVSIDPLLLGSR